MTSMKVIIKTSQKFKTRTIKHSNSLLDISQDIKDIHSKYMLYTSIVVYLQSLDLKYKCSTIYR